MAYQRTICVVTGSRAEYGLLKGLMKEIQDDRRLRLQIIATGMHLSAQFGMTVDEIISDGFEPTLCLETQISSDTPGGMAKSLGLGILSFSDALGFLRPDIIVLLGDRYEILAAAQAASLLGIPVAHLGGGEVTEGAVDDFIRHSITKASWWHFTTAPPHRDRVIQLGETPDRVFDVGSTSLDQIDAVSSMARAELEDDLGLALTSPLFLVTFHPPTLGDRKAELAFQDLLTALDGFPTATIVMTKSNADAGGLLLSQMADRWAHERGPQTLCVTSLGRRRYLSLMRQADVVIGNSSSGVIEAPALRVATINIGQRQKGRPLAASVISCSDDPASIGNAIRLALSPSFKSSLAEVRSPYGHSGTAGRIKDILAGVDLPSQLKKVFHDLRVESSRN